MEKKMRVAKVLMIMVMGLIGLVLFNGVKSAQAQDITAQQLTELAAVLEELKTCHLQCINTAATELEPYVEAARQSCAGLEVQSSGVLLQSITPYQRCVRENIDQSAIDGLRLSEGICKDACLLKVSDPQGQGMPALAATEFDRIGDAVALCQMSCFLTEASFSVYRTCLDNYEPTAAGDAGQMEERNYCVAVQGAHRSLCGRKCTDPSKYSGAATVMVTEAGINGPTYSQCYQSCSDQHGTAQFLDCLQAMDDGLISCPEDDSFLATLCQRATQFCPELNAAGHQNCRFKCMSEHATTQTFNLQNIPLDSLP